MQYQDLVILLPCHSLEDFPTYHDGEDADSLLIGWTAMWHPQLIASAGKLPNWARSDTPPSDTTNHLLIVPTVSVAQLPTGFIQRSQESGAVVLRRYASRDQLVEAALRPIAGDHRPVPTELAADFLALGYCYLQVQLLTRQMRYSSSLDEVHFRDRLVEAAQAAVAGAPEAAERLESCFQLLAQERDRYYPVTAYLLDWTLVAPTTLDARLSREIEQPAANNFQLSTATLDAISRSAPQLLTALRERYRDGLSGVSLSEADELRLPLLCLESMLDQMRRSREQATECLGTAPQIYGRRRFGLSAQLPQLLHKLGFRAALHTSLDQGRYPQGSQFKTRWEGLDGTAIDMIGRVPLDASQPGTFLRLASRLGESMDTDHVATLWLAHWPDHASPWYADLRRVARYTHALGKFTTLEKYFAETDLPGQVDRFEASQYRSPYLQQAIIRKQSDPISSCVRYWRRRIAMDQARAAQSLASAVTSRPIDNTILAQQSAVLQRIDAATEMDDEQLDEETSQQLQRSLDALAATLPVSDTTSSRDGILVLNPSSCVRRINLTIESAAAPPAAEKPVYASSSHDGRQYLVADIPAFGFAWLDTGDPGKTTASDRRAGARKQPSMVEGPVLRNEFFEAVINSTTGTLQTFREFGSRRNRLSQQIAYRSAELARGAGDDESAPYSVMAADRFETVHADSTHGEILTAGRLLRRDGSTIAKFEQRYQLWRGSRILLIDVRLQLDEEPAADPWNSYYALRFAWGDETADLYQTLHESRQRVGSGKFESPLYVDLMLDDKRTTILTGGLPFHRRVGMNMLDSLLITRGEQCRHFQFGIGLDLQQPLHDARALLTGPTWIRSRPGPLRSSQYGWLFHLDNRQVVATHLEPIVQDGSVRGMRMRLLESTGRAARVTVSAFRPVQSAKQTNFLGEELAECGLENGRVRVELAGHEWVQLEAHW